MSMRAKAGGVSELPDRGRMRLQLPVGWTAFLLDGVDDPHGGSPLLCGITSVSYSPKLRSPSHFIKR